MNSTFRIKKVNQLPRKTDITQSTVYLKSLGDEHFDAYVSDKKGNVVRKLKRDTVKLKGSRLIYFGDTGLYKMTNYSDFENYECYSEDGKVIVVEDRVAFEPNKKGRCCFYINNDPFYIHVRKPVFSEPRLTTPLNDQVVFSKNFLCKSYWLGTNKYKNRKIRCHWMVYDNDIGNILINKIVNNSSNNFHLENLKPGNYSVKVRYEVDGVGISQWSKKNDFYITSFKDRVRMFFSYFLFTYLSLMALYLINL